MALQSGQVSGSNCLFKDPQKHQLLWCVADTCSLGETVWELGLPHLKLLWKEGIGDVGHCLHAYQPHHVWYCFGGCLKSFFGSRSEVWLCFSDPLSKIFPGFCSLQHTSGALQVKANLSDTPPVLMRRLCRDVTLILFKSWPDDAFKRHQHSIWKQMHSSLYHSLFVGITPLQL